MYTVEKASRTAPPIGREGEIDPLLRDLYEKKQSFRKNVVSLAAELKDARARLTEQEISYAKESLTRKEAENKAKNLEAEIWVLQSRLEERNGQLQISASSSEKYLVEIDGLKSRLALTEETVEKSAASAESAQLQCFVLLEELKQKTDSLNQQEDRVTKLGEQLYILQQDLLAREATQKQLKDYVFQIEQNINEALGKVDTENGSELTKRLQSSPQQQLLVSKDEEIVKLKDEIRIMSSQWKLKSKDLEMQLEKHRRTDQELKKKVLKLEYCVQESRSQARKIQRIVERNETTVEEVKERLSTQKVGESESKKEKHKVWESCGFKIAVSMSMLILVVFSKR